MANGYTILQDLKPHEIANMTSWAPFIGLVVVVIFCAASWFLAPKGENQTYVRRNPISPSKLQSPSKPCLRTKTSLEQLLAFHGGEEKKRVGVGKRVRFNSDTKSGDAYTSYTQSQYTFSTQSLHAFHTLSCPVALTEYTSEKGDGRG
jgi:hypothetical protein